MTIKSLFSQHFLEYRLPNLSEWDENYKPTFEQVRLLWAQARQFGNTWNEAQTEEEFVKPILKLLGWEYIVQTKSRRGGQITRPDYALFANETTKRDAMPHQGNDDAFYSRSLVIGEAKYWGRPLSSKQTDGRDDWKTGANPSHQMVSYLVGTRCAWGILTNGMTWRLYSREVSSTASQFYEIDLSSLFDFLPNGIAPSEPQIEQFKRWWLFFRKYSFLPDSSGESFIQRVLQGSDTYAREVSDKLKELVFEQVMPEIAGGYIAYRHHEKNVVGETAENLTEIYRASLSLLYKLLFLLYAEARFLLPMDQEIYRRESLTDMAQHIARQVNERRPFSTATYATPLYDRLLALFRRVDRGDPSLNIPRYNGGLFSSKNLENQFIEGHKLSDQAVARAVDILVRDAGQPVDYAFISVRNLGSIYEGLLENKLNVIDARAGQVELINDKGERKSTGSYYTPDYIVEYIVENTLTPILDEREKEFGVAMQSVAALHDKLARTMDSATNRLLRAELETAERQAREAFLGIKVLDPAMGSGHFPVNAVDFLTDEIIRRMQVFHDTHEKIPWEWNPIQALIERVRNEILAGMQSQNIQVDSKRLDDTALLTRLVMKRCIYGVDLNPMAVELAKLSLWLHSFTVGAPLSFLDHHLRQGNSLIGTDVRTVEKSISEIKKETKIKEVAKKRAKARGERAREVDTALQFGLFKGPFSGLLDLTSVMTEIAERADATLADVRQSAEDFERFQQALTPYKRILDLWVSQYFDNQRALEFLSSHRENILDSINNPQSLDTVYIEAINRAYQLWQEKGFFHWDLEFPEVFVDLENRNWAKNPGFDAVIGNPPYVRPHNLDETFKKALWALFPKTYQAKSDILNCFIQKGLDILHTNGHLAMITAENWRILTSAKGLREYILENAKVKNIGLLPDRVFSDASVNTVIIHLQKEFDIEKRESNHIIVSEIAIGMVVANYNQSDYSENTEKTFFAISQSLYDLRKKMEQLAFPLQNVADVNFGLKTGDDSRFLKSEQTTPEDRPLISSKSIDRFSLEWDGSYVWYVPENMTQHRSTARPGEPQRFEQVKIIASRMAERLSATVDDEHYYVKDALLIHPLLEYAPEFICALINSRLLDKYYSSTFTTLDLHRNELMRLPIRQITFTTPS